MLQTENNIQNDGTLSEALQPALIITDADIGYEKSTVLRDVNLRLFKGGIYRITGPNGSGKTTLLRTMLGLQMPLRGKVEKFYKKSGYVPQKEKLNLSFPVTVKEALELSFTEWKYVLIPRWRDYRNERIRILTQAAGLRDAEKKLLRECSGGELQRFLSARALLKRPDFLVMDEPFSAVDAKGRENLINLIKEIYKSDGITIVYVSHDRGEIMPGRETVIRAENGRIVYD